MAEKKDIISKHKKNLKLIKRHNENYYNYDNPEISDAEYDLIKKNALNLEKKFPYLKQYNSINKIIGSKPLNKFKKIKHLSPMLSLSNAFNLDDMEDFLKKISNFLSLKKECYNFFVNQKLTEYQQL